MADESMWDRVRKELATPWDWVAAGVGAAGGLGVSMAVGGADAGTSAGIGALAAVSARKAGAAAFRGRALAKRAHGLRYLLHKKKEDSEKEDSASTAGELSIATRSFALSSAICSCGSRESSAMISLIRC